MSKRIKNSKPFLVYFAYNEGSLLYIGHGISGRENHVNSGTSHVYGLNKLHFQGITLNITPFYFSTKQEASDFEIKSIKEFSPDLNKVHNNNDSRQDHMRIAGVVRKCLMQLILEYRKRSDWRGAGSVAAEMSRCYDVILDTIGIIPLIKGNRLPTRHLMYPKCYNLLRPEAAGKETYLGYRIKLIQREDGIFMFSNYFISKLKEYITDNHPEVIKSFDELLKERLKHGK